MGELAGRVRSHAAEIGAIAAAHRARNVRLFGSVARGDDGPDSDVDLLVEFEAEASILDQVHLELALRELLNCDVDVVAEGGLKARDSHLLKEAVAL